MHGFDLHGHGRSEGPRALVRSPEQFLDDVDMFLERILLTSDVPSFLFGHSMGGAIVALHAIERRPNVRGVLLSGAATLGRRGRWFQRLLVATLARVAPRIGMFELDAATISRDEEVVGRYDGDPLVYRGKIRAGMLWTMVRMQERIAKGAGRFDHAALIMHGTDDRLVSKEASVSFHRDVASSDKTLLLYDGLYHEILNEPERDQVLADMIAWMDERLR